jgi:hypothetical protein
MSALLVTRHAAIRMAQRSIPLRDADLIAMVGTRVEGGYLVRERDCQAAEHFIKKVLGRIRRLRGKRLVVADGQVVTAISRDAAATATASARGAGARSGE